MKHKNMELHSVCAVSASGQPKIVLGVPSGKLWERRMNRNKSNSALGVSKKKYEAKKPNNTKIAKRFLAEKKAECSDTMPKPIIESQTPINSLCSIFSGVSVNSQCALRNNVSAQNSEATQMPICNSNTQDGNALPMPKF